MVKLSSELLTWCGFAGLTASLLYATEVRAVEVSFKAQIIDEVTGCEIRLPRSTLTFLPLLVKDLTGGVTTYQIEPLQVGLLCDGTTSSVKPLLTLQGNTPYAQTNGTVFLDGSANGVGFMVRQNKGGQPDLASFYNTALAIPNQGERLMLTTLNENNSYHHEEEFWVGLVGPLSTPIEPGSFKATLTVNVVFL